MERINLGKAAPELYQAVAELDHLTMLRIKDAGIQDGFAHLLKLRASQINQCAFCIRMHTQDAIQSGESIDRISLLNAWYETEYYTLSERAALKLIEGITHITDHQLNNESYAQAHEVLSAQQISAIEWLAIVINTWNRIAISSHYLVKP